MQTCLRAAAGALAFGLMSCALPATAGSLVADGGFEQPVVGPGGFNSGFQLFTVGQTFGSAWTVIGSANGNVAVFPATEFTSGGVSFAVQEGAQALDLTGGTDNGSATGVQQTIATAPGTPYLLTFYLGTLNNAAYGGSGNTSVVVHINGSSVGTFTNANASGLTPNWTQYSVPFTAAGSSTTIDFVNNTAANVALAGLDNVQVVPTAPPPSIPTLSESALIALGIMLVGVVAVRRRKLPAGPH